MTMLVAGIGLVAFRDPNGIRPLSIGKRKDSLMIASESSALTALEFEVLSSVAPGQAIIINENGELFKRWITRGNEHLPCLFEFVYFSRPDSNIDSISVHKTRLRMGDLLGEKVKNEYSKLDIDVVIPIPDTSRTARCRLRTS